MHTKNIDAEQVPGYYHSPKAVTATVFFLALALGAATLIFGTYDITAAGVWEVLTGGGSDIDRQLILNQRLPRLVAALVVGASLGVAGAIFQSVSRNPLGSPDIIGFTTGSATGALVIILVMSTSTGEATGQTGPGVGAGAIIGGFFTAALVLLFASTGSGISMGHKLVLVGIAIGAMLASVNDYLLTRADLERAETAKTWLYGSLNALSWAQVALPSVVLATLIPVTLIFTRRVRILELGDDLAAGLGLSVRGTTWLLIATAVLLTATAIALAGPIGFVALIAPQLARRIWRTPGAALVESALTGALLLALADFVAARALAPFQIPVGLVTGAVGGLYLLWMLRRK